MALRRVDRAQQWRNPSLLRHLRDRNAPAASAPRRSGAGEAVRLEPAEAAVHMKLRDADDFVQRQLGVGEIGRARQPAEPGVPAVRVDGLRRESEPLEIEERAFHLI